MTRSRRKEKIPSVDGGTTVKYICYGVKEVDALDNEGTLASLVWLLADRIGMKGVEDFRVNFGKGFGRSVVLVIAESHIAVHTWPESKACRVVVDSCRSFSVETGEEFLRETLSTEEVFTTETFPNRPSKTFFERVRTGSKRFLQ